VSSFDNISKTHNHSIEHSDSDEMTSKKTQPNFLKLANAISNAHVN
jgi:hypothetical protein